ncbi:MAG: IPExxxVDY family protein [Bacteroidetes bacterium]|nr:IPExxxVDY family protein [Bacteroidota bacterium]
MAKKMMLESRAEPSFFTLAGVSCHLKDYRLSYLLNKKLPAGFRKLDDLPGNYSLYLYEDVESRNIYYLICNRSEDKVLFPELKQTDFILLVEGPFKRTQLNRLISSIKAIPNVLMAFDIKPESLKNLSGFLADLELHLMEISRGNKMGKPNITKK